MRFQAFLFAGLVYALGWTLALFVACSATRVAYVELYKCWLLTFSSTWFGKWSFSHARKVAWNGIPMDIGDTHSLNTQIEDTGLSMLMFYHLMFSTVPFFVLFTVVLHSCSYCMFVIDSALQIQWWWWWVCEACFPMLSSIHLELTTFSCHQHRLSDDLQISAENLLFSFSVRL